MQSVDVSSASGSSHARRRIDVERGVRQRSDDVNWLPQSQNGLMVGDYIQTAFTGTAAGASSRWRTLSGGLFDEVYV